MNTITQILCKCGCGLPTTFNTKTNKFNEFIIGGHKHHYNAVLKYPELYNKEIQPVCKCGCGKLVLWNNNRWNLFLKGHNNNRPFIIKQLIKKEKKRKLKPRPMCQCGCGKEVNNLFNKYCPGHYNNIQIEEKKILLSEILSCAPLCKCGCGNKVTIKKKNPLLYNDFVCGHNCKTEEHRIKMRIKASEYYCPNIGKLEFIIFPKLQEVSPYKIYCLTDQKKAKCGYHLDGYIVELNLVIEVDESFHNHSMSLEKDSIREENIRKELNCDFFRIKENSWFESSDKIIKEFSDKINNLKLSKNL